MLVKIKRQKSTSSTSYWQEFQYDGPRGEGRTLVSILDHLNGMPELADAAGQPASPIAWECSCRQGICGGCAMLVNGRPALACKAFLKDIKGDHLRIEPLLKFPVIEDLVVDRGLIHESLIEAQAYLGARRQADRKDHAQLYSVAKCLKCGLCLEACPNYVGGERFFGALFANESFFLSRQSADRKKEIGEQYVEHFAKGCSKAFSCETVCPAGIETLSNVARMNRAR